MDFLDIAFDEIKPHHYKEAEDPKLFKSEKSGRGPLTEGWRNSHEPIMCCYKVVNAKFEVWGLQTKVEDYVQGVCILGLSLDFFPASCCIPRSIGRGNLVLRYTVSLFSY